MSKIYDIVPVEGKSMEEALSQFNEHYVPVNKLAVDPRVAASMKGKFYAEADKVLKREMGEEFDPEKDTKSNLERLIEIKMIELEDTKTTLETQLKAVSPEEIQKIKDEFETKLKDEKEKIKDLKEKLKLKEEETVTLSTNLTNVERQAIIKERIASAKTGLTFTSEEINLKAFNADLNSYEFSIDEEGREVIKKDGNIVLSKSKAGENATYRDIIEEVAKSNKALQLIPEGGKARTEVPNPHNRIPAWERQ